MFEIGQMSRLNARCLPIVSVVPYTIYYNSMIMTSFQVSVMMSLNCI